MTSPSSKTQTTGITRYPDKLAITFENGEFQFEGTDVSDTKICDCGRVMGSKSRLHCDEPECEKDAFEQVKCKCGATKDIVSIPVTVKEIVCVVCAEERHGRK